MARLLCVVEATFLIEGRGLVLCPGIIPDGDERFHVGSLISLRCPDGSSFELPIRGLGLFSPPQPGSPLGVLLSNLSMDDVPVGTECWSVDE